MTRRRLRLRCRGAVQGVGFRPTVYRLATAADLKGRVWNDPGGATVEIEGPIELVRAFAEDLPQSLPPLARLDDMEICEIDVTGDEEFKVVVSEGGRLTGAAVPPDSALCQACRSDMENPRDRRFAYYFTTCTDCGPRYSLVLSLPYDRPSTSMACFPLCPECLEEYSDPGDRRFHAEPVCCPACGPRLWLADSSGAVLAEGGESISAAAAGLDRGEILAVKGLGGFQLACRADDPSAVKRLRDRKQRPSKPLAVMVADLEKAKEMVSLDSSDQEMMASPRCPILLAAWRESAPVAPEVAPGMTDLGILLPTTPLHEMLMRSVAAPALVMTSGNASDEPICKGNREALSHLASIADAFLLHDRDVVRRVDDSVVRSTPDGPFVIRRARGWVPKPVGLPHAYSEPILAVGGHLQVTAAIGRGNEAILTPHVGDLDTEEARLFHREAIEHLEEFLEVRARVIVADAHPDYPSRWLAEELAERRDGRLVLVQHHLAHGAAVLGEHGRFPLPGENALILALDGTGWGPGGSSWGGEWIVLAGDLGWRRVARLQPLPLIGREMAVREPWRVAVAALLQNDAGALIRQTPMAKMLNAETLAQVSDLVHRDSWPQASGAGRLFEACGALLGLSVRNTYEGEAAIRLEAAVKGRADSWPEIEIDLEKRELPSAALLTAAARRVIDGESVSRVAAGFHATFCRLAAELTRQIEGKESGINTMVAGGGCLANRHLRSGLVDAGLKELLLSRQIPPGDGGLAYGQAVLAASCLHRVLDPERLSTPITPAAL
ncbi:MAG: carbamoyltransferase HypF [Thermoanaerobaculales bacterium]|nr:carbamoyltransferase HypF [Thermoanaerobaculales bacterium]